MTKYGFDQLEQELAELKFKERPQVIQAIAEARSHGDLSENAEYDAAKERQAFVETRIADIEVKISQAQIIDPKNVDAQGRVIFGATINLLDLETEEQTIYQIVGDDEASVALGKISVNSPVARGIIGKTTGDIVEIKIPNGVKAYEVLGVSYI